MKRTGALLILIGAFALSASPAGAASHPRRFAFVAATTARTVELPGVAKRWNVHHVSVNGNSGSMYADDLQGNPSGYSAYDLYGYGVALHVAQRGRHLFITAVALRARPHVVVRYSTG